MHRPRKRFEIGIVGGGDPLMVPRPSSSLFVVPLVHGEGEGERARCERYQCSGE